MAQIYEYENYEISIRKKSDSVYIQFLDKEFYKLYSNNYLDTDILQFNMTLDIFYTVINTAITAIIEEDEDNATIDIEQSSKYIKLDIHHKYYIEFKFELRLNLNTDTSLGAKDICIKKLENNIISLQKRHDELEKFINDYMELTVFASGPSVFSMRINTPEIIIVPTGTPQISINTDLVYTLYVSNTQFHTNFKLIKCHTLTITNDANYRNIYDNLPQSITKLILKGHIAPTHMDLINLPNIKILQIESSNISNIHSNIKHLQTLKTIRMTNCTSFQERDLLLTNGYKFEVY